MASIVQIVIILQFEWAKITVSTPCVFTQYTTLLVHFCTYYQTAASNVASALIKLLLMQTIRQYLRQHRSDLPPIPQHYQKSPFSNLKQNSINNRSNNSKSIAPSHRRAKTIQVDHITSNSKQRLQPFFSIEEMRMRPMIKYDHRISNLRLAEKLLMARPSRDTDRGDHKKFYMQQRYYREQISKGYNYLKNSRVGMHSLRRQF